MPALWKLQFEERYERFRDCDNFYSVGSRAFL